MIALGKRVRVVECDERLPKKFVGKTGVVVAHNANGLTGNTAEDPLHTVHVRGVGRYDFWSEELAPPKRDPWGTDA